MRYLCVHCDEKFELASGQEMRCPKCMRLHGLRALGDEQARRGFARSPAARLGMLGATLAVALLAGGAYAYFKREHPALESLSDAPLAPDVLDRLLEQRGVRAGGLGALLHSDAAIERFARDAAAGRAGALDKAAAMHDALRVRAKHNAFVIWSLSEPRETPPMVASEVLSAIARDDARKQLYPLEVSALAVAALRSLDVPAQVVELYALPGEHVPLDPSGRLGYFAVGLRAGKDELHVFDVYGGRPALKGCSNCAVLNDLEAVGAALSLRAGHRVAQNDDPAQALRDSEASAKLFPSSATIRSSHGAVLLASGARELGQSEFEAAAQLRPDPARRNNLAMLELALGDSERAAQEVARALSQQPDFAGAHVTLAQIHIARGERDLARAELEKAEALDAKLPALPMSWAQFYASSGEIEQAIEHARRAVELRPRDPQVHLMLARMYHQASRYDDMRGEARTALSLAPQSVAPQMRELITRMLGPTSLEDPTGAGDTPDPTPPSNPVAPLPGASKAPKLHLSDPDTTLKLRDPSP